MVSMQIRTWLIVTDFIMASFLLKLSLKKIDQANQIKSEATKINNSQRDGLGENKDKQLINEILINSIQIFAWLLAGEKWKKAKATHKSSPLKDRKFG